MTKRNVVLPEVPDEISHGLQRLQQRLELRTEFPPEVLAQAERLAEQPPDFADHLDRTDIEFVTIDPPGAEDLDQALHIERDGDGYLVHYAIADVAAWVTPGSPIDREAHLRGETMYAPSARLPLHPGALSEAAASLQADGRARPAMLWAHRLDRDGKVIETTLQRAMIRNRAKLDYESVQADIDAERGPATLGLLREVGQLRRQLEIEREASA